MRTLAFAMAALLASGSAALAAPASVSVTLSPHLYEKARDDYGLREVNGLAQDLQTRVEKRLANSSLYDGARIELVLDDVQPNRPTFAQLGRVNGLSMRSISLGGIHIEGRAVAPNGAVTPLSFKWYSTDLRDVRGYGVWTDAMWGGDQFVDELAHGHAVANR